MFQRLTLRRGYYPPRRLWEVPTDRKSTQPSRPRLPRGALSRVHFGASFAEYDEVLRDPTVFVETPASIAALDPARQKYFFVGRRGTGKTATGLHLLAEAHHSAEVHPNLLVPTTSAFYSDDFLDPRQRPYRSLLAAFRLTLAEEIIAGECRCCGLTVGSLPYEIRQSAQRALSEEFDERLVENVGAPLTALEAGNDAAWIKAMNAPKNLENAVNRSRIPTRNKHTLILDRLDESWDGAELSVVYLSALMHASLQLNSQVDWGRVLIFIRENVFERVRAIDPEFSRLETAVVGLDWTREKLVELVERRLNAPFRTKLPLGGQTWDEFFEGGEQSRAQVLEFCQRRPRDVVIYCSLAIETALAHGHSTILLEDLQSARRRFSDSRLKDLGDEYAENYPQIALLLSRFYGLARRLTLRAIEDLLAILWQDQEIQQHCATWLSQYNSPELLVRLLYDIGFLGLVASRSGGRRARRQVQDVDGETEASGDVRGRVHYRSTGPRDTTPPPVSQSSHVEVHPSYWDALDLQDALITELDASRPYQRVGLVAELPEALTFEDYFDRLVALEGDLNGLPKGDVGATKFEDIVGDVLRLCFHRSLTNVEPHCRTVDGRVIRDWVAANRADGGFWEVMRQRYAATEVVWECKNYEALEADDFHQIAYYLSNTFGRFGVIAFRGAIQPAYYGHVRRIATDKDGMIILLNDGDLKVFIRQARNGKVKDAHIQDRYDNMVRMIS
jgi:hypothetical protein